MLDFNQNLTLKETSSTLNLLTKKQVNLLQVPQAKLVTLIAAKWREFAAAAGQYKKSKVGLVSPATEAPGIEKIMETPTQPIGGKESGMQTKHTRSSFLVECCFVIFMHKNCS